MMSYQIAISIFLSQGPQAHSSAKPANDRYSYVRMRKARKEDFLYVSQGRQKQRATVYPDSRQIGRWK